MERFFNAEYLKILELLLAIPSSQGLKRDTSRAVALNEALKNPSRAYPTIHVAGSNGKGSVVGKIAKAFQLSGYRVGVYISPHLIDFRERITINEQFIEESAVIEGVKFLLALSKQLQIQPTFFELTTFLAFEYFRKKQVDVAVIETGIGGRGDATNVIHPQLSIITSISHEHSELLGEELEQIAFEKAGIIKEGVPVVLGPNARYESIYARARPLHSPVLISKTISDFFDEENSATAQLALEQLSSDFILQKEAIAQALAWRPPCRFEIRGSVVLDVAHNKEAVFHLLQALYLFFPDRKLRFLVGYSRDKDYAACLELIADVATHIHLVQANSTRAVSAEQLQSVLTSENPQFSTAHSTIREGIDCAYKEILVRDELLVVCGSFYIMSQVKEYLEKQLVVKGLE